MTSKGLTATFAGKNIQGIAYQVLNSAGIPKFAGTIKPVNDHPDFVFIPELEAGKYTLSFKATNCVAQHSKTFDVSPAVVCDPLGVGDGEGSEKNGLEAKLTYLPSDAHAIQSGLTTGSFHPDAAQVTLVPSRIILSHLNVPTRLFSEGFKDEATGVTLKDLDGDKLVEYFSLQAQSNIVLDTGDAEGDYELALLSDDGSILDLDASGEGKFFSRWIDNDGVHGNKLGCAKNTLSMTRGKEIPIKMNYYQGPRERISLMMLWRLKGSSTQVENECGKNQGDDYYFRKSATSMSDPTDKYKALLSRGWKVMKIRNFVLPGDKVNPCHTK